MKYYQESRDKSYNSELNKQLLYWEMYDKLDYILLYKIKRRLRKMNRSLYRLLYDTL